MSIAPELRVFSSIVGEDALVFAVVKVDEAPEYILHHEK